MTLFERLRNGVSNEPATANPAIPANSATPLAGISRNSSSSPPANQFHAATLTATHCRFCGCPAHETFVRYCPSCGLCHPFAATDEISNTLTTAEWAISQATLTTEQKNSRLADLRRDPGISRFWAALFDPTIAPTDDNQINLQGKK